jgi:hypothetical protein
VNWTLANLFFSNLADLLSEIERRMFAEAAAGASFSPHERNRIAAGNHPHRTIHEVMERVPGWTQFAEPRVYQTGKTNSTLVAGSSIKCK